MLPVSSKAMFQIPVHSLLETFLPGVLLCPAQHAKLLVTNEVTPVIEGAVLDVDNLVVLHVKELAQVFGYAGDGALLLCANIVGLPNIAFVQHSDVGICYILHIQVAARGLAVAVNRQVQSCIASKQLLSLNITQDM